jgi:phage terminase large subunit-like protein
VSEPCTFQFDRQVCGLSGEHDCQPRVAHAVAFFTELIVHTKGDYARRPFLLSPWQRVQVIEPLLGRVVWDEARGRYVRRYRTFYLNVARKNGKSELLAALVLYLLCADGEEGAEIYGLALDKDQAGVVYLTAKRMVELSPALQARLKVLDYVKRIVDEQTASYYVVVAGDAPGALGTNPHAAYIDELLTQPSRDLYDAVRTGMGTRAEPLLMLATTAENDPSGFAATEREWSTRVAADPALDPSRLVVIHSADPDADWTAYDTWAQANPALDDFLDSRVLAAECHAAVQNPAAERSFRQYRLNQPVGLVGRAIALPAWDLCGTAPLPELTGTVGYGGLDLASTSDLAAYALDFPQPDGAHAVLWRHFAPEAAVEQLDRRTGGRASTWAQDGTLTVTPGNVIDYDAIKYALEEDAELYDIREIAFDRWGAAHLSTQLSEAGWPIIAMGQGFGSMSAPTVELLRLIAGGFYHHGDNPLVRWEASNLVTRMDPAGNLKPDKQRSADKIDGMVAGIMALDRALRAVTPVERRYAAAGF